MRLNICSFFGLFFTDFDFSAAAAARTKLAALSSAKRTPLKMFSLRFVVGSISIGKNTSRKGKKIKFCIFDRFFVGRLKDDTLPLFSPISTYTYQLFFSVSALIPWPRRLPSLNTTSLLVVLLCILLSLCSPCNSTPLFAPTMHTSHRSAKPKWVNPCGIDPNQMRRLSHAFGGHYAVQPLSDAELLQNVILAAKNALRHSKVFKESYVSSVPSVTRAELIFPPKQSYFLCPASLLWHFLIL